MRAVSIGCGPLLRAFQTNSLFGLEHFGENTDEDRRHGYVAGRIEFNQEIGFLRVWPRIARRHGPNGWIVIPEYDPFLLEDDQGTRSEPVDIRLKVEVPPDTIPRSEEALPDTKAPSTKAKNAPNQDALTMWKEKLEFYQVEFARTADPSQKFNLRQLIKEGKRMIEELGG